MAVRLRSEELAKTLEQAYVLAIGKQDLSAVWTERAELLDNSPSLAFVAAVGSVLLAKATDPAIDAFVIKAREGSPGAFSLRAPAKALAAKKGPFGYDIGSTSDRDPINHSTLNGSTRWDIALDRILEPHKPFFQLILTWLSDVNRMSKEEATEALAAFVRVRRSAHSRASAEEIPVTFARAPSLTDLVGVLDGFVGADPEVGARGIALAAAAYSAAGFEAAFLSRTDPRRLDVVIRRNDAIVIGAEIKQVDTFEATADTLAKDAAAAGARRALLVVLRPGTLIDFDRISVIRRAEVDCGVVLRIAHGARELLHEAVSAGSVGLESFCAALPRLFAEKLQDIRTSEQTLETWTAIASRWS